MAVTRVCVSVYLCVCLSLTACTYYCTNPDVTWIVGCPLVVHYWANLQSGARVSLLWQHRQREISAIACTRSMPGSHLDPVLRSEVRRGQMLKAKAEADTERSRPRPRPRPKFWSWGRNNSGSVIRETALESGGFLPNNFCILRHSNSPCSRILRPSLALCRDHRLNSRSRYINLSVLFTLFILLLGACHILICCSSLNLPPLNPGVTNFQGHSFKTSVTNPLPSIIYFPFHVIHLSCLGSEQPHGLHVLSHAPKNIVPLLITP